MSLFELLVTVIFFHTCILFYAAIMLKGVRDQLYNLDYDLLQMNNWLQLKCAKREEITTE